MRSRPEVARRAARVFSRVSGRERRRLLEVLRAETVGGVLLLLGAAVALLWASSPWSATYEALRGAAFGPESLHLRLTVAQWASDGLLAIFFFVAGLELKHELVAGDLSDPTRAVLPVVAALSGVAVPALIFLAITWGHGSAMRGWAVPTATDIAFALAVLALAGSHLPSGLRSFLLTLAVVDDIVAIVIIGFFYSDDVRLLPLVGAVLVVAGFGAGVQHPAARRLLHRRGVGGRTFTSVLVALALTAWALVHASGVHATVAGVVLGLAVPVRSLNGAFSPAERLAHVLRPLSSGLAVPVFALMAAGVAVSGAALRGAAHDLVAVAVVVALVVGKTVGVFGGTWLTVRFTRAQLDDELAWSDVLGVSMLAGIGFTVSLLVGELAFGVGSAHDDHVKMAVLSGSVLASVLGITVLRRRNAAHRRIAAAEASS
ncbi:MAG TPA: Na+/H+ antiporter NhaA [Actinomycetales bacterium]|nr:Na+/H+ antiporter NhaA [Actinomycetales bacterium]